MADLLALVAPRYSNGELGRKPVGLDIMVRFALSDPGMEDAPYESPVFRRFAGRAPAPDETMILKFRHRLEEHELCGQMLDMVNLYLENKSTGPSNIEIVPLRSSELPSTWDTSTPSRRSAWERI